MSVRAVVEELADEHGFSGVVRVDREGRTEVAAAYGLANRAEAAPVRVDTRFGIASGTKGLTACVVMSLVEDGALGLSTTARSLLGEDLPLVEDAVTVEQLLAHRSGIGDYIDEDLPATAYQLPVPVHELVTTEDYLAVLDGHPTAFPPGERFSYCNAGYVVLALLAERAGGAPFAELVHVRVCEPAGMTASAFLRSDELPAGTALGYLPIDGRSRTNLLHLPVVGSGDGGLFTTVADVHAFWVALFEGRIVHPERVAVMVTPRSDVPAEGLRYGLGFWLHATGASVQLEGADAGVSFRSVHDPSSGTTATVVSNTSDGAWHVAARLATELGLA